MRTLPESDWKVFRELSKVAYERFCERALAEVSSVQADAARSKGDQFDEVLRLMKDRHDDMRIIFDDQRRSTAFMKIVVIRFRSLWTDDEFARFSAETRDAADSSIALAK